MQEYRAYISVANTAKLSEEVAVSAEDPFGRAISQGRKAKRRLSEFYAPLPATGLYC